MSTYCFEKKNTTTIALTTGDMPAGDLKLAIYRPGNGFLYRPEYCEVAGAETEAAKHKLAFTCAGNDIKASIELITRENGLMGRMRISGVGCVIAKLLWELPVQSECFNFVPAFMYGDNAGGDMSNSSYPRLTDDRANLTRPGFAEEWLMRTDRSSHGFTAIIGQRHTFALGGGDVCFYEDDGSIAEKTGISTSVSKVPSLSYSAGFVNHPYTYSVQPGRNYISRPEGYIDFSKGSVVCDVFVLMEQHANRCDGADKLLRSSYAILHKPHEPEQSIEPAVEAVADALLEYGYCKDAKNFHTTFLDGSQMRPNFSSAWAGGAQVAYPLLLAGYALRNEEWRKVARTVLSNLAQNARSDKSGLFFDNYNLATKTWNVNGWWSHSLDKIGHSSYVNGQLCYYLLQGYLLEKRNGILNDSWIEAAKQVLNHVLDVRADDGRFGYIYDQDRGKILDPVGFAGVCFAAALATLAQVTGEREYLNAADDAMAAYRPAVQALEVFGTPMDAFKSPDEEGILGWIKAAMILHQVTGQQKYLDDLLAGLSYEFSWKFAYDVVNEVEPLKSLSWSSTGGSVTSVNNSHIHPMGSVILPAIRYAAEVTGDQYFNLRFQDTLSWTLNAYLHYDGHYGWGKRGVVNERYCYTDSLLLERFADGSPASTWFCGHSWASGSVLEGLAGSLLYQTLS